MIDVLTQDLGRTSVPLFTLKLKQKQHDPQQAQKQEAKDITYDIAPRLIALTVTDNRGFEADTLTLTLDDADGKIQMPQRGNEVSVAIGRLGELLTNMGTFTIDQVTHRGTPDQVVVTGRSVDFRGNMNSPKEWSWHDTTLGEVVKDIAWRNSLSASVAPALANIKIAHIDQSNESDIGFLTRLATRNGAEIAVKSGTLIFLVPGMCVRGGKVVPSVTITRSDGDSHEFTLADRVAYSGVVAHWQDTRTPNAQTKQIKLTRKAATTSNAKPEATDYTAGSKDNIYTLPTTYASKDEAMRAAEAQWQDIQRNAAKFTLTLAQGRTDISAESPVYVSGFKDAINNTPWVIKKVTHGIDSNGFISKLELEVRVDGVEYEAQE